MALHVLRRVVPALRRRLARDQRGIALIEVLVAALLLAIVAVGLLSGFDVASSASGTNKARAVAASIAQDDQERMRGLEVRTLLLRGPEVRTVKAGPAVYTVKSTAEAMTDSIEEGCTAGSTGVDYLTLRSEVTWSDMRTAPVAADSLMAPRVGSYGPDEGGMSVQLIDRDGEPLPGIAVALEGGKTFNDVTDENGCAFFAYIPAGDYLVRFSVNEFVTTGGIQDVAEPVSVPVGAVGNEIVSYDRAAKVTANVKTKIGGVEQPDPASSLAAAHANIPAPGALFFQPPAPSSTIETEKRLFPFASDYSIYSGECLEDDPGSWGQPVATVKLERGAEETVNVIEPAVNVLVRRNGTARSNARVRFYGATCPGVFTSPNLTDAFGRLPQPGMPYGDYEICAQYPAADSGTRRHLEVTNVKNQSEAGTADIVIDILDGSPSGSCPTS